MKPHLTLSFNVPWAEWVKTHGFFIKLPEETP